MKITNGFIDVANQHPTEAHSGRIEPAASLLVMHYTASGGDALTDARYFETRTKKQASAHLILGREGVLYQSVNLEVIAHHAGRSIWRGRTSVNRFSIGIEIDNWGPLDRGPDGLYRSWAGTVVPEEIVFEGYHKNGDRENYYWERYPVAQLNALDELTQCLLDEYGSLRDIAGHDDIAPNRKSDPGPAFPMKRYLGLLSLNNEDAALSMEVWAESLNVRAEPSTDAEKLDWGPLPKGALVEVLVDAGDWSFVDNGQGKQGWVFDKYLTR